eukprot:m51a1_g2976 putative oxidation resistance protein (184) ;mRNA; r:711017-712099
MELFVDENAVSLGSPRSPSFALSQNQFEWLLDWLPTRLMGCDPVMLFATQRDGFSLSHLFRKCAGHEDLLLVVESATHNKFGAFLPLKLSPQPGRYVGTGEAFLYRMCPFRAQWEWVPGNKPFFTLVEKNSLSIGHGSGLGLALDDELCRGVSQSCDTFLNLPLNGDDEEEFGILDVEVLTFV